MSFPLAHGSVPPMITPMSEDAASVDRDGIAALVEWHIEAGTTGLFVVCSTGEMFTLSQDEMVEGVEVAVVSADGRIPIIAGVPFPDVERQVEVAKRYEAVGAAGGIALQPFKSPADDNTMYEHYVRLADKVTIPLLIYEHPKWQLTHLLTPVLVNRLATTGRYFGMKDCTGDLSRLTALTSVGKGQFGVMQAVQEQLLSVLECGATGACTTASNVYPHLYHRLYDTFQSGDIQGAYEMQTTMRTLFDMYKASSNSKRVLNELGLPVSAAAREKREITEKQARATDMLVAFVRENVAGRRTSELSDRPENGVLVVGVVTLPSSC